MDEARYREAEQRLWSNYDVSPDEKMVSLATTGTRVRVQVIGDGPPVLFIHGGPNAGSTWAPITRAFDGYTALLVDRPGTGLSDPLPHVPTPDEFVGIAQRFVPDVLDGMALDRAHVVASSLGGFIALHSAANAPERFERMVQMACPAMAPGMLLPPFMRMLSIRALRRFGELFPPNQRMNDRILRQIGHAKSLDAGRFDEAFDDWYLALQRHTDTMRNDGDMIGAAASFRGTIDPTLELTDDVLAAVSAPTLYLWGADDGFGGLEVAERTVSPMPNARFEIIGDAGHLPWLDFPADVGARTRAFLETGA